MAAKKSIWPKELTVPLLLSLIFHVGLVALLVAGMHFEPKKEPTQVQVQLSGPDMPAPEPEIVEAITIDQAAVDKQVEAIQQRQRDQAAAESRRQAELERKAREAKQARERELQKLRELEKQQEAERRRLAKEKEEAKKQKEAAEKAAADAEARRKREEEAARKAEAERKKREEEAKRLEEERKKREQEAAEKAERERQINEQLEREAQARQRARSQQVLSEVGKYTALITGTIQRNLIVDDSMRGKQCVVNINLAPSGFVISVTKGAGDARVCQAAETAVLKAGTLPVSKDPEVFAKLKNINLTVKPEL